MHRKYGFTHVIYRRWNRTPFTAAIHCRTAGKDSQLNGGSSTLNVQNPKVEHQLTTLYWWKQYLSCQTQS